MADRLHRRVLCHVGKGLVNPQHHTIGISNRHAILGLKGNRGNAQLFFGLPARRDVAHMRTKKMKAVLTQRSNR